MIRNRTLLVFVFCLLCVARASAQEAKQPQTDGGGGLVYGKDHMFAIKAPKGWVLDNVSGIKEGLYSVFYPEGSSWKSGAVVMYVNTVPLDQSKKETVDSVIEYDLGAYKKHSPSVSIESADPLATRRENHKAVVKHFSGDRDNNYEAVAYVGETKVVVMLVLTARTKGDFQSSLRAFKELVASYFLISDVVTMDPEK